MLAEPQRAAKEGAGRPPRRRRGVLACARALLVSLIAAELMIASGPAAASMPVDARRIVRAAEKPHLGDFSIFTAFLAAETLSKPANRIRKEPPSGTKLASVSSRWQSPDPMLASYMQRGAMGASPKNVGLYSYAWNNPVVMRDPNGREVEPELTERGQRAIAEQQAQEFRQRRNDYRDDHPVGLSGPGPLGTPVLRNPVTEIAQIQQRGSQRSGVMDDPLIQIALLVGTGGGSVVARGGATVLDSSEILFSQSSVRGVDAIAVSMKAIGWV